MEHIHYTYKPHHLNDRMNQNEQILSRKLQNAVAQFKEGNFRKAVSLFSEVVDAMESFSDQALIQIRRHYGLTDRPIIGKLIHPKLLDILDQRTASHEKLKDFKLAARDVKRMLDMDPSSCKAHLRMGKLLLLQGREIDAYKAFQRGVFTVERAVEKLNIDVSPKLLEKLKTQYRELNRALKEKNNGKGNKSSSALRNGAFSASLGSNGGDMALKSIELATKSLSMSSKRSVGLQSRLDDMLPLKKKRIASEEHIYNSRDLIAQLPLELLEYIFSMVPTYSLLQCHLVCRRWYHTLTNIPNLYTDCFTLKHRVTSVEYFSGLQLMKKILRRKPSQALKNIRLRSTRDSTSFAFILENLISEKELLLELLEVVNLHFNMDLLLRKLERTNFQYQLLRHVKHLRLVSNMSFFNSNIILELFPSLESLELVTVGKSLRGNSFAVVHKSEALQNLLEKANSIREYLNMRLISLINDAELMCHVQQLPPGETTFDSQQPFLHIHFPNLVELRVTNFDFAGIDRHLTMFLSKLNNLKSLHLENNGALSLRQIMLILKEAQPQFSLKTLAIREGQRPEEQNLGEFSVSDFPFLSELQTLDIYSTYITINGLDKLLQITNRNQQLENLNLGHVGGLYFRNDSLAFNRAVLDFYTLFSAVPRLRVLALPEMALDNLSMRLMATDLERFYGPEWKLDRLDLSLCHSIDGIGIMSLLGGNLQPVRKRIELLILDGLSINTETLSFLIRKGIVGKIIQNSNSTKCQEFGNNSHLIDLL